MSRFEELFSQAVAQVQKRQNNNKFTLTIGTVKGVDSDTCTVDNIENVRLNAIIDDLNSQFTIYPKIGSMVVLGTLESEDDFFVAVYSEIDKVTIKIGNQLFEMKDGKFKIQSGSVNLKSVLSGCLQQLQSAVITTPSGPGSFSPTDITAFANYDTQLNQLLE